MVQRHYPEAPLVGVCTAIWRGDRMVLVQRGREPNMGQWAMPGGLVDVGEPLAQAAQREVLEETALAVDLPALVEPFEIIRRDDTGRVAHHYILIMHAVICSHGEPVAGDDAAAVGWYSLAEMERLDLTGNTWTLATRARRHLGLA
ncbi:MAG: NUDIX hydrolase [Pseudomonadota bacterium]